MTVVKLILQIVLVVLSLLLTLLILMHKGKGGACPTCSAAALRRTPVPLALPRRT